MNQSHILVLPALLVAGNAWAEATVVKQNKCIVLVKGLTNAAVGSLVNVADGDATVSGSVTKTKGSMAIVQLQGESCSSLVGSSVSMPSSNSELDVTVPAEKSIFAKKEAAPAPRPMNTNKWYLNVGGGYASMTLAASEESKDSEKLSFGGFEVLAEGGFSYALDPKLRFPLGLMITHLRESYSKSSSSGGVKATATVELVSSMMGPSAGVAYKMGSLELGASLFYAYGLLNTYSVDLSISSGSNRNAGGKEEADVNSFQRYGASFTLDTKIDKSIAAGLYGSFSLGSLSSEPSEKSLSHTILAAGLRGCFTF